MPVDGGSFEKSAEKSAVFVRAIRTHPTVEVTRHRSETVLKADGRSIDDIAREADVSRSTVIRILRYVMDPWQSLWLSGTGTSVMRRNDHRSPRFPLLYPAF